MSGPDPRLQTLGEAIADDTPVDWAGEESASSAERLATVRELKALALIAAVNRRSSAHEGPAPLFRWGHLEVLQKLGEGSFAEVFRARDPTLGRDVALKLRRPVAEQGGSSRTWLDEAHRLARVRHPHVLVVHGAAVHDGRAGIWTDLVNGRTLEEILLEEGAFGAREAALIGIDLCGALAAVHEAGLVHGDLKTRNVMREGEAGASHGSGRIVLMDFGSASELEEWSAHSFGTPLSTAPEVLAGSAPTPASDLYSLGVLLYRLVTLRYPAEAGTMRELTEKLERNERVPLRSARSDLPADFVRVVERAMSTDPGDRFASAAELERALASLIPQGVETHRRESRMRAVGVAIVVVLAVTLVAGIATILGRGGAPRNRDSEDRQATSAGSTGPSTGTDARPSSGAAAGSGIAAQGPVEPTKEIAVRPPEIEVSLERVSDGSREPLRTGDRVDPGDRLSLRLAAREQVYAYVLNEDETGDVFVLFPLLGRGAANPLAPGSEHRLPGGETEADLDWQVTSAGGKETFLILVAREPLDPVEEALRSLPPARLGAPVSYAPLVPEALGRIRGVGGVARRPPGAGVVGRGGRLETLAEKLSNPPDELGIWIRLIVLENPGIRS